MYVWYYVKMYLLRVRLELTTSALLTTREYTVYKYGALTDCATGASVLIGKLSDFSKSKSIYTRSNAVASGEVLTDGIRLVVTLKIYCL